MRANSRRQAERGHPLLRELGARVRMLRAERDLTRRALAEGSGLSERFVAELEAGRGNISILNLAEIARVLGVQPASLLPAQPATRFVSLLGLRGAGKTTIGQALAKRLGVKFYELDRLVEADAGMRLHEIFAVHGESYFRAVERDALKRLLTTEPGGVLATSGGVVASPEAFRLLLESTVTVWLRATPEEHWDRVVGQGDLRPMQNRPQAMVELRRRLKEREPEYAKAQIVCSTSRRKAEEVVGELQQRLAQS
jgi:XRE family transcriptional regulator, aerobic/anaerobic benzoate catabolism transcriptional regulator